MFRTWQICYSDGEIIELRRVNRPSRFAKAMMYDRTLVSIRLYRIGR